MGLPRSSLWRGKSGNASAAASRHRRNAPSAKRASKSSTAPVTTSQSETRPASQAPTPASAATPTSGAANFQTPANHVNPARSAAIKNRPRSRNQRMIHPMGYTLLVGGSYSLSVVAADQPPPASLPGRRFFRQTLLVDA